MTARSDRHDSFLARWSRRKVQAQAPARTGQAPDAADPDVRCDTVKPGTCPDTAQPGAPPDAADPGARSGTARPDAVATDVTPIGAPRAGAPEGGASPATTARGPSRSGHTADPPAAAAPAAPGAAPAPVPAPPPPTLADVAGLTRDADFSRFVAPGVDDTVKRAALKKLFSDPHFNVMDGLDVYIDDYSKAAPLPATMLRKMAQAAVLGLLRDEDENPDLQLQPDDADRRPGPEPRAAGEPGREDGAA